MDGMLMLLVIISITVVLAWTLNDKQRKRVVSLLLCAAMMSSYIPAINIAKADVSDNLVMIDGQVVANGSRHTEIGSVTYSSVDVEDVTETKYTIDMSSARIKVWDSDVLSFKGMISVPEGEMISWVRVDVYDAETEIPYTVGTEYYRADGLKTSWFDLQDIPAMTIGEDVNHSGYTLEEGKKYILMFSVGVYNGYGFADHDQDILDDQGPAILIDVKMSPENCDHPHDNFEYALHNSGETRVHSYDDPLTHQIEPLYERYCGRCGIFLMNIWGQGKSEEHSVDSNGVCTDCGYAEDQMMLNAFRSIPAIQFINPDDRSIVNVSDTVIIEWKDTGLSEQYVGWVKRLDGEPAEGSDNESGSLMSKFDYWTSTSYSLKIPADTMGKWIKINVHGKTAEGIQTEAGSSIYIYVEKTCLHKGVGYSYTEKYYPIDGDDESHDHVTYCREYCKECDKTLSEAVYSSEQEEHEFYSDGRCSLCRYKKELPCYHTYSDRELMSTGYQKKNDTQHYIVYSYKVTCKDCGILLYSYMPEYQSEAHAFNGAETCTVCGWSKGDECLHLNEECTQFGETEYNYDYLDEYEPIYHWADTECVISCKDCGEVLEEDWFTSELEPHRFDSNNYCVACGYHGENLIEDNVAPQILSFTSSVGTTVAIGQMPTYEAVVYDENLRCVELMTDDGWTLDSVLDPVSDTVDVSAWSYAGEAGTYTFKVVAVDYAGNSTEKELVITIVSDETDCQHTDYTDHYNAAYPINYWEKDKSSHYYQLGYDRKCNNCPESWVVYSDPPLTDDHTFEEGACLLCGYTNSTDRVPPSVRVVYISTPPIMVGNNVTYRAEVSDDVELFRYMLYINEGLVDAGPLSGTEDVVEFSTTELPAGEYYFKLAIYDKSENEYIDEDLIPITVVGEVVEDNASPVIDSIKVNGTDETTFVVGTELTFFTTAADETALSKIELYIDGDLKQTETVSGLSGTISYTTSSLAIGQHIVEVVATDTSNLMNNISLIVNVTEEVDEEAVSPVCNHTNASVNLLDERYLLKNTTTHIVQKLYCTWCDECENDVELTSTVETEEGHSFDEQRKCVCGYVEGDTCTHEYTVTSTMISYVRKHMYDSDFNEIESTKHGVTELQSTTCQICGVLLARNQKEYTQAHEFNNDRMCTKCGYQPDNDICRHYSWMPDYANATEHYELCADNPNLHIWIRESTHIVCMDCGARYEGKDTVRFMEAHTFEDSVCYWCGYEDPATSEKKAPSVGDIAVKENNLHLGDSFNLIGTVDGGDYDITRVSVSLMKEGGAHGIKIKTVDVNANNFDLSRITELTIPESYKCGYCKTNETFAEDEEITVVVYAYSEEYGKTVENEAKFKLIPEEKVNPSVNVTINKNSVEIGGSVTLSGIANGGDHFLKKVQVAVFTDDSESCGYHDASEEFALGQAKTFDLSKLGEVAIKESFICNSHSVEEEFPAGEAKITVYVSVYDGNGTSASDYVTVTEKVCDHQNVIWKEETYCEPLPENTATYHTHHTVIEIKRAYCNDCDRTEPLDTLYPDLYSPQEVRRYTDLHQLTDGVCLLCGYEATFVPECAHQNKDEASIRVEKQTENEHIISFWYFCNDCKTLLNNAAREERTEAHTFDENDVCKVCGYTENLQNLPMMTFTVDKPVVNAGEDVEFKFTMTGGSPMANKVMLYAEDKYILTVGPNEKFTFDSNPEIGVFKWKYRFNEAGLRKIHFVPLYEDATKRIEGIPTAAQEIRVNAYLNLLVDGIPQDTTTRKIALTVYNNGGSGTPIDVDSNMNWTVSTDAEWITLTADKNKNQILHHYEPNTDGYERTATIMVSAPSCEDWTIIVTQGIIPLEWAGKVGGDYERYAIVELTRGTLNPNYTYELQVYDEAGTLIKTKEVTVHNQFDYYKDLGMLRGKRYRMTVKEYDHEGNLVKEYPSGIVSFDYHCSIDEVRSGKTSVTDGGAIYSGEDISFDWTGSTGYGADICVTIGNKNLYYPSNKSGGTITIKASEYEKHLTSDRTNIEIVVDVEGKKAERKQVIIKAGQKEDAMILSPDNGEIIRVFDGEEIVVKWSPFTGADYYKVQFGWCNPNKEGSNPELIKSFRFEKDDLLELVIAKSDLVGLLENSGISELLRMMPDNVEDMLYEFEFLVIAYAE